MKAQGHKPEQSDVRLDTWLWSVRLFKKRAEATEACHLGRVNLNDRVSKPAHKVKVGDVISFRIKSHKHTVSVLKLIGKRVPAQIARACYEDLTPVENPTPLLPSAFHSFRGKGRPTKKQRRDMDRMRND
jgi:ribosome-associated heat shock protein Hsp15